MITTEDFTRARPGWQEIEVDIAGTDITMTGLNDVPQMILWIGTGTASQDAILTYSPTESTLSSNIVTCRFYSTADDATFRILAVPGVSAISV